jgi:pimeloyl-ACP methyl ester carboxylesterase
MRHTFPTSTPGQSAAPPRAARARWFKQTLIALSTLTLLWLLSTFIVAWKFTHRRTPTTKISTPAIANLQKITLTTSDHERLGAWFIRGHADHPYFILLHGIGGSREDFLPLIPRLAADRCSILAVTLRAHGDSTGSRLDFGYSSRLDVLAAVEFIERDANTHSPIIILGTSLGAAAALFAAEDLGTRVDGYILESPYRDLATAVHNRLSLHLPRPLNSIAYAGIRLWSPLVLPVSPAAISPLNAAGKIPLSIPVLILTGASDHHATPAEAEAIFQQIASHARLEIFDHGGHATLYHDSPDRYYNRLQLLIQQTK